MENSRSQQSLNGKSRQAVIFDREDEQQLWTGWTQRRRTQEKTVEDLLQDNQPELRFRPLQNRSGARTWDQWQVHRSQHLISSGMYKNCSLNTTAEMERWVNGSRDWMDKLG